MSKIVFDIGGSNLRVAHVESGSIGAEKIMPTPKNPKDALAVFIESIEQVTGGEKVTAIAGGIAGVIDNFGTVLKSPNLPEWKDFPLAKLFAEHFSIPVTVRNDAEMAGLGEACYGAGSNHSIVAYLGIGTGVGGTRIVGRMPTPHIFGFEPGQQILDTVNKTTLESLIGGASLTKKYNLQACDLPRSVWNELTSVFAAGIMNTIVHWSPDVVVLGGSLMNEDNGFRVGDITDALEKLPSIYLKLPPLLRARLGDKSGLYGALATLN